MQAGAPVTENSVVVPGSLGLHGLLNRRSGSTGGWTWGPAMPLGTLTLCPACPQDAQGVDVAVEPHPHCS